MKKYSLHQLYFAVVLLIVSALKASAQDIHFSQFYETSILRNPALTGIFSGDYKVGAIYRSQWSSISAPFQTALATAEGRIAVSDEVNDFVSFGLLAYYDKAGSINLQTLSVYPAINYNKSLEDKHGSYLSLGFTGGYVQRSFDPGRMTFDEQYQNGVFSSTNANGEILPNPKVTQWDLGAGMNFSSSAGENNDVAYFVGVAAYHLTRPKDAFFTDAGDVRQDTRWNVNLGLGWRMNDLWKVQFNGNYMLQGAYSEIIAGGLLCWNKMDDQMREVELALYAGLFYRVNDAIIPTFKLTYRDFGVTASYDFNVSKLKAATNLRGGFEISAFKTGLFKQQYDRARTVCPKAW